MLVSCLRLVYCVRPLRYSPDQVFLRTWTADNSTGEVRMLAFISRWHLTRYTLQGTQIKPSSVGIETIRLQ